jgi:hypothetical protein
LITEIRVETVPQFMPEALNIALLDDFACLVEGHGFGHNTNCSRVSPDFETLGNN